MKMPDHLGCGLLLLALLPFGCGSAKVGPRAGAAERSQRIATLEAENRALEAQVRELPAGIELNRTEAEEIPLDALPQPVELAMASGSVVRAGDHPVAEIRLRTLDARGRFVQVTGPVDLVVVAIDRDGEPHRLAVADVDPEGVRSALRDGFMGASYVFDLPIDESEHLPAPGGQVMVRAIMHDARLTGPMESEELIPVLQPRRTGASEDVE